MVVVDGYKANYVVCGTRLVLQPVADLLSTASVASPTHGRVINHPEADEDLLNQELPHLWYEPPRRRQADMHGLARLLLDSRDQPPQLLHTVPFDRHTFVILLAEDQLCLLRLRE